MFHHILHKLLLICCLLPIAGCTDDFDGNGAVESGLPASITLNLSCLDMEPISRGELSPALDGMVRSLWIAVYNAETGERTGVAFLHPGEQISEHKRREITINALSGPSYIVGVANYDHRSGFSSDGELDISLEQALNDADTYAKYEDLSVAFSHEGDVSIDTPINPLMMTGFYTEDKNDNGLRPEPQIVNIQPGISKPSGAVHLRSLFSQVKFQVKYDKNNIQSLKVTSYKICNLPVGSWLRERTSDDPNRNVCDVRAVNGKRYSDSPLMVDVATASDVQSFDFWMIENRRTGLDVPPAYTSNPYPWRELQYTDASGKNTGKFQSLVSSATSDDYNNMATFVLINVDMELKVDENGKQLSGTRTAHTTYMVHLGYCEGSNNTEKARDFNCRRNSKYTYNITIKNIGDILMEAKNQSMPAPGTSGTVTDITASFHQLDAHYAAIPVKFTAEELENFRFLMRVYDLDGNERVIDSDIASLVPSEGSNDFMYYSWVEFRRNTDQSKEGTYLESYKPHGTKGTYYLGEMNSSRAEGWYTMFINEYVYETGTAANGNESRSTNWHNYVNRPDRRLWINVKSQESADGESIYYNSKYAISQHSIQTYYKSGATTSALGLEHIDESYGLRLRNNYRYSADGNHESARYNQAEYLASPKSTLSSLNYSNYTPQWSTFLDVNSYQKVDAISSQNVEREAVTWNLPSIIYNSNGNDKKASYGNSSCDPNSGSKYTELMRACLNRNRDNDGDGVIDASEIRWIIPTKAQYIRLILGCNSLQTPVLDITNLQKLPNASNSYNSSMFAGTSDGSMIWLMEGTSDSQWTQWGTAAPWMVRCVRTLGTNLTVISDKNTAQPAFYLRDTSDGTYVVDLKRYDSKSLRTEAIRNTSTSASGMPVHHILDQRYNRCYSAFEFSSTVISLNDSRLGLSGTSVNWSSYLASHNPCAVLNTSTKGGWRVPNQMELSIIAALGYYNSGTVPSGTIFLLTCSYSYFDIGGNTPGTNAANPSGTINSTYHYPLKCRIGDGGMTQSDQMYAATINNNYYGVRCVRDTD